MPKNVYIEFDENEDLVLPSQRVRKNKFVKRRRPIPQNGSSGKALKWGIIIGIIVLLYLFYNQIMLYFLELMKTNPTLYSYYLYIESQISNNTLKGLLFVSVLGSLFFLVLPSEALFIYYLSSTDHFFILIMAITLFGSMIGLSFNYFFGRVLGEGVIRFLFRTNFDKYKEKIDRYGGYVLFFGNVFPGPIEVLTVFFGGFKFHYGRFLFLSFMGRLIKYLILFFIYLFFWDSIVSSYGVFLDNFLVLKDLYVTDLAG